MKIEFNGELKAVSDKPFTVGFEINPKEAMEIAEMLEIPVKEVVSGLLNLKTNVEQ